MAADNESVTPPPPHQDDRGRSNGPWRRGGAAGGGGGGSGGGGGWGGQRSGSGGGSGWGAQRGGSGSGGGRGGGGGWGRDAGGAGGGMPDNRPTHFLALRLTHAPGLMAAVAAVQRLLAGAGAAPALVDPASAHLTLCLLDLRAGRVGANGEQEEDDAAVVARCAARLAQGMPAALERAGLAAAAGAGAGASAGAGAPAGGLALRLGGLGCFGRRVMFMRVLGEGQAGRGTGGEGGGGEGEGEGGPAASEGFRRLLLLQWAAAGLVAEWDTEAGGGRKAYNPHLTLAKHKFGGRGGGGRWQPAAAAEPLPLDRLLLPCADDGPAAEAARAALLGVTMGPFDVTVPEVLLCRMGPRAGGEFYAVEAAAPLALPPPPAPAIAAAVPAAPPRGEKN